MLVKVRIKSPFPTHFKKIFAIFPCLCLVPFFLTGSIFNDMIREPSIVLSVKRIYLPKFPTAFNPSLIKTEQGYLLLFRYTPDPYNKNWISSIGIVLLNEVFDPISEPELLSTRSIFDKTASQSEDARIFSHRGKLFVIYNDNMDIEAPKTWERRDIYISELRSREDKFYLSTPKKLVYVEKYSTCLWQKNWSPFEWNKMLLISYFLNPHEIIYPNLHNGDCFLLHSTRGSLDWNYGPIRGGTPSIFVENEYLGFFHSAAKVASPASFQQNIWHYFMGVYTFSPNPPFEITNLSRFPIWHPSFYVQSFCEKRVIFPGGFVLSGPYIHLAYGKDDCEMWIATLDYKTVKQSLIPVGQ